MADHAPRPLLSDALAALADRLDVRGANEPWAIAALLELRQLGVAVAFVEGVCWGALASDRFESMQALARDLARLSVATGTPARAPSAPSPATVRPASPAPDLNRDDDKPF
jgi:hypothetical protein